MTDLRAVTEALLKRAQDRPSHDWFARDTKIVFEELLLRLDKEPAGV